MRVVRAFGDEKTETPNVSVDFSKSFPEMLCIARGNEEDGDTGTIPLTARDRKVFDEVREALVEDGGGEFIPVLAYDVGTDQCVFLALSGGIGMEEGVLVIYVRGDDFFVEAKIMKTDLDRGVHRSQRLGR